MSSENNSTPVTTKWYAISWMIIGLLHIMQLFWPIPLSDDMYLAIVFIMMIMTAIYYTSLTTSTHSHAVIISNINTAALIAGATTLLTLFLWVHHTARTGHVPTVIWLGCAVFIMCFVYLEKFISDKK